MVELTELKKIFFLKDLPENMLEKIASAARMEQYDEETILFRQGEELDAVYALIEGRVFLNSKSPSNRMLTLDEVTPGRCFGVSSIIDKTRSSFAAICVENCRIIQLSSAKMSELFKEDRNLGFVVMTRIVQLFKSRMDNHTRQFMRSLATHPEIQKFKSE